MVFQIVYIIYFTVAYLKLFFEGRIPTCVFVKDTFKNYFITVVQNIQINLFFLRKVLEI